MTAPPISETNGITKAAAPDTTGSSANPNEPSSSRVLRLFVSMRP
jgi:hypothetical protein